jgi:hypothetical protein
MRLVTAGKYDDEPAEVELCFGDNVTLIVGQESPVRITLERDQDDENNWIVVAGQGFYYEDAEKIHLLKKGEAGVQGLDIKPAEPAE